jgi:hypothetical protein
LRFGSLEELFEQLQRNFGLNLGVSTNRPQIEPQSVVATNVIATPNIVSLRLASRSEDTKTGTPSWRH